MLERVAWVRSPEERLQIRQEKEKPIFENLSELIKERMYQGGLLPKAKLTRALHYYQGLEP
jgi:hypothetical protein